MHCGISNKDSRNTVPGSRRWQQYASEKYFPDALEKQLGNKRQDLAFNILACLNPCASLSNLKNRFIMKSNRAAPRSSEPGLQSVPTDSQRAEIGFSSAAYTKDTGETLPGTVWQSQRFSVLFIDHENNCSPFS